MIRISKLKIAASIPVLNIIFDIFVMHFEQVLFFRFDILRAVMTLLIFGYLIFDKIKINAITVTSTILIMYFGSLVIFRGIPDGEFYIGIRWFSRTIISMIFLFVGYSYFYSNKLFEKLNIQTLNVGLIMILYLLTVNIFDIGSSMYVLSEYDSEESGVISTGALVGVSINTISFVLLLYPIIFKTSTDYFEKRKLLYTILFVLLFVVLLLVLRRSALVIVIVGYLIYLVRFEVNFLIDKKYLIYLIPLTILIIYYSIPFILNILEIRGESAVSADALSHETRTREVGYMILYFLSLFPGQEFFTGISFNTVGAFPLASINRSLHSDFSMLLYVSGALGLFLYLLMHVLFLHYGFKFRKYSDKIFYSTLLVLVIASLLLIYPGRLTGITYRTIFYLYLGGIFGTLKFNYMKFKSSNNLVLN